jgi:general secretion pathway protein E
MRDAHEKGFATREEYAATERELAAFGRPGPATLYRARAEPGGRTGYRGRTGIYELIGVDETMRRLIHEGASEAELERHARSRFPSILDDGWAKCTAGISAVDEVLRVTRDE